MQNAEWRCLLKQRAPAGPDGGEGAGRRPRTFLHGEGAGVGIALFNTFGAIGGAALASPSHPASCRTPAEPAQTNPTDSFFYFRRRGRSGMLTVFFSYISPLGLNSEPIASLVRMSAILVEKSTDVIWGSAVTLLCVFPLGKVPLCSLPNHVAT